jgi:hypothetical protein
MIVEVVAREIGERGGAEADAVEPALQNAVRRGLKGEMGDTAARQPVQSFVQVTGSGVVSGPATGPEGATTPGVPSGNLGAERGPPDARNRRRGLAARSGDRDVVSGWRGHIRADACAKAVGRQRASERNRQVGPGGVLGDGATAPR